jgi:hypothetical protein
MWHRSISMLATKLGVGINFASVSKRFARCVQTKKPPRYWWQKEQCKAKREVRQYAPWLA